MQKPGLPGAMPDAWLFALGALFVITTLWLPKGIVGLYEQIRDKLIARKQSVSKQTEEVADHG